MDNEEDIMVFKLSKEQIDDIIEMYGGSKKTIDNIEKRLNLLNIVQTDDDYLEIVTSVLDRKQEINEKLKNNPTKQEAIDIFMTVDEIIAIELERKYGDFEYFKEEQRQKVKSFIEQKKRHN